jgi:hypothetical protein
VEHTFRFRPHDKLTGGRENLTPTFNLLQLTAVLRNQIFSRSTMKKPNPLNAASGQKADIHS